MRSRFPIETVLCLSWPCHPSRNQELVGALRGQGQNLTFTSIWARACATTSNDKHFFPGGLN